MLGQGTGMNWEHWEGLEGTGKLLDSYWWALGVTGRRLGLTGRDWDVAGRD